MAEDTYDDPVEYQPQLQSFLVRHGKNIFWITWAEDAVEAIMEYFCPDDGDGENDCDFEVREWDVIADSPIVYSPDVTAERYTPNWEWNSKEEMFKHLGLPELARSNGHCLRALRMPPTRTEGTSCDSGCYLFCLFPAPL